MTFGQKLILQQIQLVAHARGWDIPKTIKKTTEVLAKLQQAHEAKQHLKAVESQIEGAKTTAHEMDDDDIKLIQMAEDLLKESQTPKKPETPSKDAPKEEKPE
jgi:hypothetical protein